MQIKTARLLITDFAPEMAEAVHLGSLDEDTARFVPDEVFPTVEAAADAIAALTACYSSPSGPFVHPMLHEGEYAGYVQLSPLEDGWEIGYHTVKAFTGRGLATEAVRAFLPVMMDKLAIRQVEGICLQANAASVRVLEKCGFQLLSTGHGPYQGEMQPIVRMRFVR